MSPELSTAVAAWLAAGIAGLFGVSGFVVGLIGLRHARQAKESAAAANLIAKDANQLSRTANSLAEESNGIAREAQNFSREINERENELHDVTWEWTFGAGPYEGLVEVLNVGKMTAEDATVQFKFDDVTEAAEGLDIAGRAVTRLEIPGLRESIASERERRAASRIKRDTKGFMVAGIQPFQKPTHIVRLRVSWRTPLGASKQFDTDLRDCLLPE
jgi:hypothetical protein